jgi:hypothetical protein
VPECLCKEPTRSLQWPHDCGKCHGIIIGRAGKWEDCPACGAPAGYSPGGPCENHGTPNARLIVDEEGQR